MSGLLNPELYAQLLEKKRQVEDQNNLAPAQSFVGGLMGGIQKQQEQAQLGTKNAVDMWKDLLTKYDLQKAVKNPTTGQVEYQPFDGNDMNQFVQYTSKTGQLPKELIQSGSVKFAPKTSASTNINLQGQIAGAKETAKRKADIDNPLPPKGGAGGMGGAGIITPEAKDLLAEQYIKTGQLPALGMGGFAIKGEILNLAAKKAKEQGKDADSLNYQKAAFAADSASLKKISILKDQILSFERTANKNFDIALGLSNKVDRSGSPILDQWLLAGKKSVAGNPDVAAFDAAIRVAINEAAKVTSGASGGAVTSDSARKEIEGTLNSAMTPEQVHRVIDTLRQDMENRKGGFDSQISDIRNRLKGTQATQTPQATTAQTQATHGKSKLSAEERANLIQMLQSK